MITKIKELMKIKDLVDEIKDKVKAQDKIVEQNRKSMDEMTSELKELVSQNKEFHNNMKKDITAFKDLRSKMNDELCNFRLFKKESRKLFIQQMEREFNEVKRSMKSEIQGVNDLKKALDTKLISIEDLDSQIKKLTDITKKINAKDFELSRHKKNLDKAEKEKLELMRKIDSLERLVSRMRRKN